MLPLTLALFLRRAELSVRPDLIHQLVPPHAEQALYETYGIEINNFEPVDLAQMRVQVD
jgi:glycogen synthase kinase 3 beta